MIDQMSEFVNIKRSTFRYPLDKPCSFQGGKTIIERLITLFRVRNRVELADILGMTTGTIATWQTRDTIPFELLVRIHLATGVSMDYLCFGGDDSSIDVMAHAVSNISEYKDGKVITVEERLATYRLPSLKMFSIENGHLKQNSEIYTDKSFMRIAGVDGVDTDMVIKDGHVLLFINSNETAVSNGRYLFAINQTYQIGDLRMLPDGHVYLFHEGDKYQVDPNTTKIHGKVVSVLEKV
ncbi:helix-turn-helix transcriptional regulator [Shewanella baltica]|uniref:helix-turn-helix transcriptional regulator n=1 Tax=Shewanella baltica TaxID=62322 RepID=UPI00217D1D4D|nr:helix-turn-helix transcriptional regulator [Shewanella baltica]